MNCLAAVWTAVLCSPALAQAAPAQESSIAVHRALDVEPIRGSVRHAGVYNVATGSWTRGGQRQNRSVGPIADTIYCNAASSGLFSGAIGPTGSTAGGRIIDAGAVPGLSNPGPFSGSPDREFYRIDRVVLGYCDFDASPGAAGWGISFYDSYSSGTAPAGPPRTSLAVTGLPSNGCWIVELQLDGCLQADGGLANPGWDNDPASDSFGIELRYIGTGTAGAGPIIAGDPANTDPGWAAGALPRAASGTYFGGPGFGGSTGYLNHDELYLDSGSPPGVVSGGAYVPGPSGSPPSSPWSGLFVEVKAADSCSPSVPISAPGCTGLPNVTGSPGVITAFGNLDVLQNDCQLVASHVPAGEFGIFVVGLADLAPGTIPIGNGTLCISPSAMGGLGRFGAPNQIRMISASGDAVLDSTVGDWDTTAINLGGIVILPFFGQTTYFQFWHREPVGGGANITGSCSISWL